MDRVPYSHDEGKTANVDQRLSAPAKLEPDPKWCDGWNYIQTHRPTRHPKNRFRRSETLPLLIAKMRSEGRPTDEIVSRCLLYCKTVAHEHWRNERNLQAYIRATIDIVDATWRGRPVPCELVRARCPRGTCTACKRADKHLLSRGAKWCRTNSSDASADEAVSITLEEAQRQIHDDVISQLRCGRGVHVIAAPPGSGKTTTVLKTLAAMPLIRVLYLARSHDLFDQASKILAMERIQGRERLGCSRMAEVQQAIAKNLSPKVYVCKNCGDKSACRWRAQFREGANWFATTDMLKSRLIEHASFDVVVVDENPASVFIDELEVSQDDVDGVLWLIGSCDELRSVAKLLTALAKLLEAGRPDTDLWGARLLIALEDRLEEGRLSDLLVEIKAGEAKWRAALASLYRTQQLQALPINFVGDLVEVLQHEHSLYVKGVTVFNSRLVLHDKLTIYKPHTLASLDKPVIVLDGTMDESVAKAIFGEDVTVFAPAIELREGTEVVQIVDGEFGIAQLMESGEGLFKVASALYDKLTAEKKTGVLCGPKAALERYSNMLEGKKVLHYGDVRGINAHEDDDFIILVGACNPDEQKEIEKLRALCWHQEFISGHFEYVEQKLGNYSVLVRRYDDEQAEAWLNVTRRGELVQAAHRLRMLRHPGKSVYILSNIPLPSLRPTRVIKLSELKRELGVGGRKKTRELLIEKAEELLSRCGEVSPAQLVAELDGQLNRTTVLKHLPGIAEELGLERKGRKSPYRRRAAAEVVALRRDERNKATGYQEGTALEATEEHVSEAAGSGEG